MQASQSDTSSRSTKIYCFLCAKTGNPVYVGKTTMEIERRISNHYGSARRKAKSQFHIWLKNQSIKPNVIILESVPFEQSSKAEVRWIKRFQKRFPLLNMREYSAGNPGCGRIQWTEELLLMLGKKTDGEISELIGCVRESVAYKRKQLGIPRKPDPHRVATEIFLDLITRSRLGLEPDYKIANDIGVSKFVIAKHRKRLGIKSYAVSTGNNGRIKEGEPHRRWTKY